MIKKSTPLKLQFLFFLTFLIVNNKTIAQVTSLTESFDDVVPADWVTINHSAGSASGSTLTWFQGDPRRFTAYSGLANSYAAANYESAGKRGTINNWLVTPELKLTSGGAITFYTRTIP